MKRILTIITSLLLLGGVLGAQEKVRQGKTSYNTVFDLLRNEPGVTVGTNSDQTQPLFVVDGIITDNVTYLRPEDIYSVEVLKDGTSSIYGMQGQNGVIIFRTKAVVEAEKQAEAARKAERKAARAAKRQK